MRTARQHLSFTRTRGALRRRSLVWTTCLTLALAVVPACKIADIDDEDGLGDRPIAGPPGGNESAPQIPTAVPPTPALPAQAFVDRSLDLSNYSGQQLSEIARSPIAFFQLRVLLSEEAANPIEQLRKINPNLIIIGINGVQDYDTRWNTEAQRRRFPLSGDIYDLFEPHTAYRTDGEVATKWIHQPMVNPWRSGAAYNRGLMLQQVDVISRHARNYPSAIDGIMHDFLSPVPYIYPVPNDETIQADFDGDGVGARDDDDDQSAWVRWQQDLISELQSRFGPGLIQIGNGRLPLVDPITASRLAGIAYESFPSLVWGETDGQTMEILVDNLRPGYLKQRRGRVWSLLWEPNGDEGDKCRVASMLTGQFYGLDETVGWVADDALAGQMGHPLGELEWTDLPDGSRIYSRRFAGGEAMMEIAPNGGTVWSGFQEN